MEIIDLEEMVKDLEEEICRLNLKIQQCAEAGIKGYISVPDRCSFDIRDNLNLKLEKAIYEQNLLRGD